MQTQLYILPFQAWIYHCHLHPLQAANCCRNFRLLVDEKYLLLLLKQLHGSVRSNTPRCRRLCHSSEMQNDAFYIKRF